MPLRQICLDHALFTRRKVNLITKKLRTNQVSLNTKFTGCGNTNCSYTMMTKPMKTLEWHYPMIYVFFILKCKASHLRLPGQARLSLLVSLRTIQELSLELIAPQTSKCYFQNGMLKTNQRVVQMLSTTNIFQSNPPLFNQEALRMLYRYANRTKNVIILLWTHDLKL